MKLAHPLDWLANFLGRLQGVQMEVLESVQPVIAIDGLSHPISLQAFNPLQTTRVLPAAGTDDFDLPVAVDPNNNADRTLKRIWWCLFYNRSVWTLADRVQLRHKLNGGAMVRYHDVGQVTVNRDYPVIGGATQRTPDGIANYRNQGIDPIVQTVEQPLNFLITNSGLAGTYTVTGVFSDVQVNANLPIKGIHP